MVEFLVGLLFPCISLELTGSGFHFVGTQSEFGSAGPQCLFMETGTELKSEVEPVRLTWTHF